MTNSVSKLETENVCIVLLLLLYFSYYTLLLTEFSLRHIVDDRILKKHFALFIINIGVQRLRVPNFVKISFLCLLVTFFVAWFWRNMCYLSDIDECSEAHTVKMNKCHPKATCTNTQGSYNCSCIPRYIGDGFKCKGTFDIYHAIRSVMLTTG